MKMIAAVVKHHMLDEVRNALVEIGVHGMTIVDVKGFGRQKGHTEIYRSHKVDTLYLPKVKVEVAVDDDLVEKAIAAISSAARTSPEGNIGDGKIFVYPVEEVIRIRTGETGKEAL